PVRHGRRRRRAGCLHDVLQLRPGRGRARRGGATAGGDRLRPRLVLWRHPRRRARHRPRLGGVRPAGWISPSRPGARRPGSARRRRPGATRGGRGGPHPDGLRPPRAPRPCRPGGPTASKERTMREVLVDFITTLDGYASGEGSPGFWGLEGPEYLAWLTSKPEVAYLMGAKTYGLMSGFAGGEVPPRARRSSPRRRRAPSTTHQGAEARVLEH